jgi:DNA-binding MarR family transcriptional regulator
MNNNRKKAINHELREILREFNRLKFKQVSWEGLRASECELLGMIFIIKEESGTAPTASKVSELLNITPAGVTHLINPLEKNGYVNRVRDLNDRRSVIINLTEKGNLLAEMFVQETENRISGLVDYLGESDSRKLIELIEVVIQYFAANPVR